MVSFSHVVGIPLVNKPKIGDVCSNNVHTAFIWTEEHVKQNVMETIVEYKNTVALQILLLSDEKIKEGDYGCIQNSCGGKYFGKAAKDTMFPDRLIFQDEHHNKAIGEGYTPLPDEVKKIIASNHPLGDLPKFHVEFLKQWVEHPVDAVEVAMNDDNQPLITHNAWGNFIVCNMPCQPPIKANYDVMSDLASRSWTSHEIMKFAEWYRVWHGHPAVGNDAYNALNVWIKLLEKPVVPNYEYEWFAESQPGDTISINGWIPIATDRIKHPEKIEEYIKNGKLRKIQ